jgi:hypothetical protein
VLTTDQNGAIAELAVALEAARLGIEVYRPVQEGGRYDMIFNLHSDSFAFSASGRAGRAKF